MRSSQRLSQMSIGFLGSMPRERHIRGVGRASASAMLDYGTKRPLMQRLEISMSTQLSNSRST